MKAIDFNLSNTNLAIRDATKNQSVNYCQMLAMPFLENLSIIAKEDTSHSFVTLDENLRIVPADARNAYFGASPLVDNKLILDAIASFRFSTKESLDSFIIENHDKFSITEPFADYLLVLSRYIVIAFASNFRIVISPDQTLWQKFEQFACENPCAVGIETKEDKDGKKIPYGFSIMGCPTQSMLAFLSDFRYIHGENAGEFLIGNEGETIETLYTTPGNVMLKNGAVFYSGVLPKTTRIEMLENVYENYKTNAISLYYIESTFSTIFALDRNFTEHVLLREDKALLIDLLKKDDMLKTDMIRTLDELAQRKEQTSKNVIETVNQYLSDSVNINQIGVSANLTTSDGLLLIGKRGGNTNSYDKHSLYPGVNGNAEFADEKVAFYQYSTHEDIPTMKRGAVRNDFTEEIARETSAELSLFCESNIFSCVGLSICGNVPSEKDLDKTYTERYAASSRRCHLNVLFDAHIKETYEETERSSKNANEAFENEKIRGLGVKCHKNIFSLFLSWFTSFIDILNDYKDCIESILILLLAAISLFTLKTIDENPVSFALSLIFASTVLISTINKLCIQFVSACQKQKNCRYIRIFRNDSPEKMHKKIEKSFNGFFFHPVAYAIVELYVEKKVYDAFFNEGRRENKKQQKLLKRKYRLRKPKSFLKKLFKKER